MAEFQDSSPQASPQQQGTETGQDSSLQHQHSPSLPESQGSHSDGDEIAEALAIAKEQFPDDESDSTDGEGADGQDIQRAKPEPEKAEPAKEPSAPQEPDKVKPTALANFHRQQREFLQKQQAFAAEKAEVEKYKEVIANAKEDRLAALELLGYDDVKSFLDSIVEDGGRMTPERRELNKLKKWREEQETQTKKQQEQFQQQQASAAAQAKLDALRGQVQNTIKSDAYQSRLINLPGTDEQVMQEMDVMALETGEMPRIEDAIERVEAKFQGYLEDMAGNERIRSFFEQKLRSTKSNDKVPTQSKSRGNSRTIGSEARTPGLRTDGPRGPSDDGEREMQEALAFLKSAGY